MRSDGSVIHMEVRVRILRVSVFGGLMVAGTVVHAEERLSSESCNNVFSELRSQHPASEASALISTLTTLSGASIFRYVSGADSIITDMKKNFGPTPFVTELDAARDKLDEQQKKYWLAKARYEEFLVRRDTEKFFGAKSEYKPLSSKIARCASQSIYFGKTKPGQYDALTKSSFTKGRFGHFTVGMNSCEIKSSVGTNNRFSEPDSWAGSKFVVIDATFKNEDSEGRLPSEGSLIIITPEKKELRYDTTESVMQKGYGIYFKSVNPLVTMPTKIVYRIPAEITGEVLWEPGRNPEGKKLWCTFSKSENNT